MVSYCLGSLNPSRLWEGERAAVRIVRIEYDCPTCGMRAIYSEKRETDKPNEELLTLVARVQCPNPVCKSFGKMGEARASRIVPA